MGGIDPREVRVAKAEQLPLVRVWDGPLRLWHWAFVACVGGALFTGLSGDIGLIDWHIRCGYGALALLVFRLGWALWGGLHARWSSFRITPARVMAFLRGRPVVGPRTAPGVALVLCMFVAVAAQAIAGLFTSDYIFTDGPLVRYASSDTVKQMSGLHHRIYQVIIGLIGVHLTAHVVYGLMRDPTPLSMFTGRKRVEAAATPQFWIRGLLTAAATAALVWYALERV
jgi:cytochrome b